MDDLVDLHLVDVEMDDPGFGSEIGYGPGDPVVEPGPHGQQQITLGDGHVGGPGAVHPGHAQVFLPVIGDGPFAHEGVHHRQAGIPDNLPQRFRCIGQNHPAPHHQQGTAGLAEGLQGGGHFRFPAFLEGLIAPQGYGFRILVVKGGVEHVLGHVHQHWPGTAAPGDVEGFLQYPGQILDSLHQVIVLGDGGGDAGNIRFLEGIPADQRGGHLAADHYQGNGIHVGGGNASDHVADPGAAGGKTDAHLSRGPGIAVRCMDGALFMAGEDMGELHPVQSIIQAQYGSSRVSEDNLDLFLSQTFDDGFCTGDLHGSSFVNDGCWLDSLSRKAIPQDCLPLAVD